MSYLMSVLILIGLVWYLCFAIQERRKGTASSVYPWFAQMWYERFLERMPPKGVFELWYAEWRRTGVKAQDWIKDEYPLEVSGSWPAMVSLSQA